MVSLYFHFMTLDARKGKFNITAFANYECLFSKGTKKDASLAANFILLGGIFWSLYWLWLV